MYVFASHVAYSCVFVFSLVAFFHLYSLFRSLNFHPCSLVPFFMSRIFSIPTEDQGLTNRITVIPRPHALDSATAAGLSRAMQHAQMMT